MKKPQKCVVALWSSVCVAHFILIHHSNKYVENVFHINSPRTTRRGKKTSCEREATKVKAIPPEVLNRLLVSEVYTYC